MRRLLKRDRKVLILDAARETYASRGFLGTRTQDVAQAARISPGLLFRYFPSMRALQKAVVARERGRRLIVWPRHLLKMPPRTALRTAAAAFVSTFARDRAMLRLALFGALLGNPAFVEPYRSAVLRTTRRLARLVKSWKEDGWVRESADPEIIAGLFVSSLVQDVLQQELFGSPRKDIDGCIHELVSLLKESHGSTGNRWPRKLRPMGKLPGRRR
jgi:AcrR family transcriptional regulator